MHATHVFTAAILALFSLSVLAVPSLVDLGYTQLQGRETAMGVMQWLGVPFAAPLLGPLRFSAPIDPLPTTDIVYCTAFRPICLPRQPSDFTMKPNRRFTVSEDCLFVNIFAPTNATEDSQLPVMYFAQSGGFQSNSNANFNGSQLALFGEIIIIKVNYRVGPFGFAQSREIVAGVSLNNGMKDIIQGLAWAQRNIAKFGGNPDQIVISSYAAGALLHVPTIWGNCQDEGAKNVPQSPNKTEDAFAVMQGQAFNVLSNYSLSLLKQTYLAVLQPVFNNSGVLWRQIANAHRFGSIDPEQERLGFGAYYTIELNVEALVG
ncbi:alpha/beta-hydrolase [Gonapodya prolifera JEL478]|uniref:Alpha/beta-hydrolase n=1 Tax=Gonapodya prolifera (strain JEL478) TaxID=1344416 RepID=A0A138ZY06_GONPJ|nr:alpha/beta-hydrolase [Gonapodya prolifera JEL478]|eukprot:KXS09374.1 alpha/beta-hydrolase [Gonapodya prolifera JEL478]